MNFRSYLFVPGDAPAKMAKAVAGNGDAIILDLEDSVAQGSKDDALHQTARFLETAEGPSAVDTSSRLWVRINATDPDRALREVCSLPLGALAGLIFPKLSSIGQLEPLASALDALEIRDGLDRGAVGIIGIVTETAGSLFMGADLGRGHPRLRGYCWGIEDLSANIGRPSLAGRTDAAQRLASHAQMFCLMAATAARIPAIDAIEPNFRDPEALAASSCVAAELGFAGKLAIHPAQISTINAAFTPGEELLSWAREVVKKADGPPPMSAFQIDGRMIDEPHIRVARRIVETAGSQ